MLDQKFGISRPNFCLECVLSEMLAIPLIGVTISHFDKSGEMNMGIFAYPATMIYLPETF
jgi:hypothetical protein